MRYTLDQIERINNAGDRYGHITPGVVAELIAEVRRLRGDIELLTATQAACDNGSCEFDGCQRSDLTGYRETAAKWVAEYLASKQDAARYRWAISLEDNVEQLYAAVVSCGPDMPGSINIEIDAHRAKEPK